MKITILGREALDSEARRHARIRGSTAIRRSPSSNAAPRSPSVKAGAIWPSTAATRSDPSCQPHSAFGRLVARTHAHRGLIWTPVRAYYGEADEVVRIEPGRLPMTYQKTFGNDRVEAISTRATTHRGTFAKAVPLWKASFDGH